MKEILILVSILILNGCVATTGEKISPSTISSQKVQAPKWEPLIEGSNLTENVNYKYRPSEMKLSNGMLLRGKAWDGFLKEFVEKYPLNLRDDILRGLTRFYKNFDRVDRLIKFEPLRYISGPYSSKSYVSLQGSITETKATALLKFRYYGSSWLFANKLTVVADDYTWKSPELKFYRDNSSSVWEYTYIDINKPEYRQVADKIVSSKEVIVRFHGKQYYKDITVTDRMKNDISAMLKAVDAINK